MGRYQEVIRIYGCGVIKKVAPGPVLERSTGGAAVSVSGHRAYLAFDSLRIVDFLDPENPAVYDTAIDVGTPAPVAAGPIVAVVEHITHRPRRGTPYSGPALVLYDTSDPSNPTSSGWTRLGCTIRDYRHGDDGFGYSDSCPIDEQISSSDNHVYVSYLVHSYGWECQCFICEPCCCGSWDSVFPSSWKTGGSCSAWGSEVSGDYVFEQVGRRVTACNDRLDFAVSIELEADVTSMTGGGRIAALISATDEIFVLDLGTPDHVDGHENDDPTGRAFLRVHPRKDPRNPLTGVFGTRSPLRPNLIGLSLCKIKEVKPEAGEIVVDSIDARDGTPLVDVKPYLPYSDRAEDLRLPEWAKTPPDGL